MLCQKYDMPMGTLKYLSLHLQMKPINGDLFDDFE